MIASPKTDKRATEGMSHFIGSKAFAAKKFPRALAGRGHSRGGPARRDRRPKEMPQDRLGP